MTMADSIAVMNLGRIEQLGTPEELYERPRTAFVAGFLGISNLLPGAVAGGGVIRLDGGGEVRVPMEAVDGHTGRVAVGVRPEKLRLGPVEPNVIEGRVVETAYIGVATQYVVDTPHGSVQVYVQNADPRTSYAAAGESVTLSFHPDAAFVITTQEVAS